MVADIYTLKSRVEERLRVLVINAFEAARRSGLSRDFVHDILADRKKSVRGDNLIKLARGLDCDPAYLLGEQDHPSSVLAKKGQKDTRESRVRILGAVATGIFRDVNAVVEDRIFYPSHLPPDPRFPTSVQFDTIVADDSLDAFAPKGFILRCIRPEAWPYAIVDDDLVIVERTRGGLHESSARRIMKGEDGWELIGHPRRRTAYADTIRVAAIAEGSTLPTWFDVIEPSADRVGLSGVVLFAYRVPIERGE
jgi:DNA-binding Xre family transcriptional regulator